MMHGYLVGLSGDLSLLSGAWVFRLQRGEEGVVGCRAQRRASSAPPARSPQPGAPSPEPPARNQVLAACQLRPLAGTRSPILRPWLGDSRKVTLSRDQAL